MATELDTGAPETSACVRFAGLKFDIAGRTLMAPGGREVPLRRSEFALLGAFVRAPGRALGRDHLLDAVAGHQSDPCDRSIDVLVSRLRRKIETDPKSPRLILTIPGVGYKFTPRPQAVPTTSKVPQHVARMPRRQPVIAVLPFHNLCGDPAQDHFVDGVTEEIITALSSACGLYCRITRHSGFAANRRSFNKREVNRAPGARYVLEGSVRKVDERVRITGQLIDARTGVHLWADRFDYIGTDILATQDAVAGSIVEAIEPKLRRSR